MGTLRRSIAVAAGALLIPAAAAQGATKDMFAGTPPKGALKGVPDIATDNAFYPKRLTVHKGDRVAFRLLGFHNITLPAKGKPAPDLFLTDPSKPVSGVKDVAGADFWFNGQPGLGINPAVAGATGGNVYDGSHVVGSGLPLGGPPKPFKVKFAKKGRYTVLCRLHPGMKGTIVVKDKSARIATKKQDAKRIKAQAKTAAELAKKLVRLGAPSSLSVKAGNDKAGIATIAFFPAKRTVTVGDKVRFAVSKNSTETHSVTFAPEPYALELAGAFIGPTGLDPRTVYPSEPFGAPLVVGGNSHGNGFVNTGMLDGVKSTPLPRSTTVSFSKPGTYQYYCIVHGAQMKGQITVTQ
jgi:plastocyanin